MEFLKSSVHGGDGELLATTKSNVNDIYHRASDY